MSGKKYRRNQRKRRMLLESLENRHLMTAVFGDFNGDGRSDLVTGVPQEDIGLNEDAGAISVVYGTESGLTIDGDQSLHQRVASTPTPLSLRCTKTVLSTSNCWSTTWPQI
jgi:hypothetical protein